jgi:RNA polymerase sigma-70 factor, ECF subfamily
VLDTTPLVARKRHRDEEFDVFYRTHVSYVRAYCLRRADKALAEDAVSESFEIAWRRWGEIPTQPKGWLLGVARRVLANRRRTERRQQSLVARLAAQPVAERGSGAEGPPVLEVLSRLSGLDQEVLKLAAWEELSSREAADVLGCSPVAFRLRLHRARRRLATALSEIDERSSANEDGPNGVLVQARETRS